MTRWPPLVPANQRVIHSLPIPFVNPFRLPVTYAKLHWRRRKRFKPALYHFHDFTAQTFAAFGFLLPVFILLTKIIR
jgi:hypothetical protein